MNTIKCQKCGCEMSDKSESCPVCGRRIETNEQPKSNNADDIQQCKSEIIEYENYLIALFEENVRLQKEKPQFDWLVTVENPSEQFEDAVNWFSFSNVGRILTNRPELGIGFYFTNDEKARFNELQISRRFKEDDCSIDNKSAYYLSCGSEAKDAAAIVAEIITKVFLLTDLPQFMNSTSSGERDKKTLRSYFQSHLPMMFCFDLPTTADMAKIKAQYERTQKRMEKYGMGEIQFNNEDRCVKGYYEPTEEPKGFFASTKWAGQMGDCEGELITLLSLCYESFK